MMNEQFRVFDFLQYQLDTFPKADMLTAKENGEWKPQSTAEIKALVDRLSVGLLSIGISGHDMTVHNQDKIALISANRPEWLILDMACQQIGATLCPVYPTTNINELEYIFNNATVKLVFVSGEEILAKVDSIRSRVTSLQNIYSFDDLPTAEYWKKLLATPEQVQASRLEEINQPKV